MPARAPREVVCGDAFAWLDAHPAEPGMSIVTSLPDISELSGLGLPGYRAWFQAAVTRLLAWLPEGGAAVFYQSDIRVDGVWIDKGYWVMCAAESAGALVLWHKIAPRKPPGTRSLGRSSYAHMIALSPTRPPAPKRPTPDVLESAGEMLWTRGMGLEACRLACAFLREELGAKVIVDPFCGQGSALAIANQLGLAAIGVERSVKRCEAARALQRDR